MNHPRSHAVAANPGPAPARPQSPQNPVINTVAIVEDNAVIRKTFCQWIDSAPGFRCVFACATAEEAIAEIPRLKPDVVLMDVHLPGESGIACTAQLKEKLPGVQVIILTVYRNHELIIQALQAGACGY